MPTTPSERSLFASLRSHIKAFFIFIPLVFYACSDANTRIPSMEIDATSDGNDLDTIAFEDVALTKDSERSEDATAEPYGDIEAVITADNAYSFGWGNASTLSRYFKGPGNISNMDIFNCPVGEGTNSRDKNKDNGPEHWSIPAANTASGSFLYVISWADGKHTQGLLAQFKRKNGTAIYSGDNAWEVCATGVDYSQYDVLSSTFLDGPALTQINQELQKCNAAMGAKNKTSAGWVNAKGAVTAGAIGALIYGESNTPDAMIDGKSTQYGLFTEVCTKDATGKPGIDSSAKWMWYSPTGEPSGFYGSPENPTRSFLIFRLAARYVPSEK